MVLIFLYLYLIKIKLKHNTGINLIFMCHLQFILFTILHFIRISLVIIYGL